MQSKLEEMRNRYHTLRDELKRAGDISEGMAESYKEKIKCMQIAMRIMAGDKVPIEDHRYLAERDKELYVKALSMRVEKRNPKEHDKLSEEEDAPSHGIAESCDLQLAEDEAEDEMLSEPEASPESIFGIH